MGGDTFRKIGARLRRLERENKCLRDACQIALTEMQAHQRYEYGNWFDDTVPIIEEALKPEEGE